MKGKEEKESIREGENEKEKKVLQKDKPDDLCNSFSKKIIKNK